MLTRLPVPLRLTARQATDILASAFPEVCWLTPAQSSSLRDELGTLEIVGGSVYDALVARAAAVHDRILLTRDRRAERIYRALEVECRFVE